MQTNLRTRFARGTLAADARSAGAVVLLSFGLALMLASGARAGRVQAGGQWPRSRRELSCTHFTRSV